MKPLEYKTYGHYKPTSAGKGFPRHLWKGDPTSLDEETAQKVSYGYSGNRYVGNATKMSMNKSYGNLAEWGNQNNPYPKHTHMTRWLRKHLGQNVDKVFSEFKEAWNQQPALKNSRNGSAEYWFYDYVWREGIRTQADTKYYNNKSFHEFMTDDQDRLVINPGYRGSYKQKKTPLYDQMFVRDNRSMLDEVQRKFDEQHSNGYWMKGGDAVGPIGIKRQLWIVHPKTGMPVKASVSLIRSNILEELSKNTWGPRQVPLSRTLSESKLRFLKEDWQPVDVIWDAFSAKRKLRVECKRWPTERYASEYKEWTFVVPKSLI